MPVGFVGPSHVLPGQPAADHRVVVVLHPPPAQFDVVEARSVTSLGERERESEGDRDTRDQTHTAVSRNKELWKADTPDILSQTD